MARQPRSKRGGKKTLTLEEHRDLVTSGYGTLEARYKDMEKKRSHAAACAYQHFKKDREAKVDFIRSQFKVIG